MRKLHSFCLVAILSFLFNTLFAQNDNKQQEKVKVFLDCVQPWLCDFDYVRTEMKMVDFVFDRFQSDVHMQVNSQFLSSGGAQTQLTFLGLKRFAGMNDTLTYFVDPTATDDEKRKLLVHYLKLGLTRFLAKTDIAKYLELNYGAAADSTQNKKDESRKDKWNSWRFSLGVSGFFDGSQNLKESQTIGYLNGGRETNHSKINMSLNLSNDKTVFTYANGSKEYANKRQLGFNFSYAKKLNEHWGIGPTLDYMHNIVDNLDHRISLKPRIEYSFTPYTKFNSERVLLQYSIGPEFSYYVDSTVLFKTKETQVQESLSLITSFIKPWGSINLGVFFSNYMSDFQKNNLSFTGSVNWRIFKGFSFGVGGSYAFVSDQINIQKGTASNADILTRRRALLSSYNYFVGIGFSYSFGSIYNNAIFPAFRGLNWSLSL